MGATTTEGTGYGSAPIKKKNDHLDLGVNRLIGPKIVAAGVLTLKENCDFVSIPAPIGNPSDYCILLTGTSQTVPYLSRPLSVKSASEWHFEVTAGNHDVVHYIVAKTGFG